MLSLRTASSVAEHMAEEIRYVKPAAAWLFLSWLLRPPAHSSVDRRLKSSSIIMPLDYLLSQE